MRAHFTRERTAQTFSDLFAGMLAAQTDAPGIDTPNMWPAEMRDGTLKQKLSLAILRAAYWAFPTYIWILRKPDKRVA